MRILIAVLVPAILALTFESVSGGAAFCKDGTACDGCQCCPDLTSCPNANNCPSGFRCPNDGQSPSNQNDTHNGGDHNGGDGGSHDVTFENKCNQDIWIGSLGAPGHEMPRNGGWLMRKGDASSKLTLPYGWSGRFWGRTDCSQSTNNGQFFCVTGDCGRRFECAGAGGEPPVTLAEFTFNAHQGLDFYDVSLVDGYNLPVMITPVDGTFRHDLGICEAAGCSKDLNVECPAELRQIHDGKTVACMSSCAAFNEPRYCCRDEYDCSPHSDYCDPGKKQCDPKTWPVNYAQIFKSACPTAYSYAYDDPSSTFTCAGNPQVDYIVTFCP